MSDFLHLGFSLGWERNPHYTSSGPAESIWCLLPLSVQVYPFLPRWTLFFLILLFKLFQSVLHLLPPSTITESSRTCPVSLDPCWACTSHQPLCSLGNAVRRTCWKQEVSPLTLRTRPVIQSRRELISLESDAGRLSLGFPTKLHLRLIKTLHCLSSDSKGLPPLSQVHVNIGDIVSAWR